jgi:hypothetical protein
MQFDVGRDRLLNIILLGRFCIHFAELPDTEVAGLDERADYLEQDTPRFAAAVEMAQNRASALAGQLGKEQQHPAQAPAGRSLTRGGPRWQP